ncbi:MAG: hypothetical protein AD742_15580 [Methylibium sp. NZG]|nr:MAG: hypothetical protein AD742_15580 [Methylibium sp. NZG]
MKSRVWVVLMAVAGALAALPAEAQWKWRDKGGRVQYSDLPPPASVSEQDILQRPGGAQRPATPPAAPAARPAASAASGAAISPKTVEPELEAKRRKAEEEKLAQAKVEEQRQAAARADNCARAKAQLRTIDDGIRIARTNASGEREILDDKGRAEERKRTTEIMATDCK